MWHYIMSPDFTAVITALEVRCRWSGALPRWYISLAAEWSGQTFEHNITWLWAELQVPPLGIRYQLQWDEWDARPQPGLWQGWRVCVCACVRLYVCVCMRVLVAEGGGGLRFQFIIWKATRRMPRSHRWKPKPGRMMMPNARVFGRFWTVAQDSLASSPWSRTSTGTC